MTPVGRPPGTALRVLSWAAVGAMLVACQAQAPERQEGSPAVVQLTQNDNGRPTTIEVGQTLAIDLDENASTGYTWAIDGYDENILESLGSTPRYSSGPVGSGGQVTFTFRGVADGTGQIRLKNWREWEGDSSVVDRFQTSVTVK